MGRRRGLRLRSSLAAAPIVVVILVNLVLSLVVLPRIDLGFLGETGMGRDVRRPRSPASGR